MGRSLRLPLLLAFAVALALRISVVALCEVTPYRDGLIYQELARNLLTGNGFSAWGHVSLERPPGYPAFLAFLFALGGTVTTVALVQALMGALCVPLLAALARQMALGDRSVLAAAWIVALFPDLVVWPSLLLTETLWSFLVLAAVVAAGGAERAMPWWRLVLAGLLLGAVVLVRSTAILFALAWVATVAVAAVRGDRWRAAGRVFVVAAVGAMCVLPWTARCTIHAGRVVPVDLSFEFGLRLGHHPGHTGDKSSLVIPEGERDPMELAQHERSRVHRSWALQEIRAHPVETAKRTLWKLARFLHPRGDLELLDSETLPRGGLWWLASTLATEVLLLLCILGCVRGVRVDWCRMAPALAMLMAVLVAILLVHHAGRYRQPIVFFLAPLAALGMRREAPAALPHSPLAMTLLSAHALALGAATWVDWPRYVENWGRLW